MKIVDIRDIDFCSLEMLDTESSEGVLYFDKKLLYKFYDNEENINNKEKKLILLNEGTSKLNAVIPHILIKNQHLIYGCAMKYIKNANSLIKYKKDANYIQLLYDVSLSLMRIHNDPRNIVVGDLHFNNILVDNNMRHYFIDFDSCMVDDIPQDRLPNSLLLYVCNRDDFDFTVSRDTDKLCMLLSFVHSLFEMSIDKIDMNLYDEKAEQIYTLKNLREYIVSIKNSTYGIPCMPYLHEVISEKDLTCVKKTRNIK